jgi:hypothetical protein
MNKTVNAATNNQRQKKKEKPNQKRKLPNFSLGEYILNRARRGTKVQWTEVIEVESTMPGTNTEDNYTFEG